MESICRALLAYCLVHYRGDDKIKSFMWDLIAPTEDGQTKELQNHLGENRGADDGARCRTPEGPNVAGFGSVLAVLMQAQRRTPSLA